MKAPTALETTMIRVLTEFNLTAKSIAAITDNDIADIQDILDKWEGLKYVARLDEDIYCLTK